MQAATRHTVPDPSPLRPLFFRWSLFYCDFLHTDPSYASGKGKSNVKKNEDWAFPIYSLPNVRMDVYRPRKTLSVPRGKQTYIFRPIDLAAPAGYA